MLTAHPSFFLAHAARAANPVSRRFTRSDADFSFFIAEDQPLDLGHGPKVQQQADFYVTSAPVDQELRFVCRLKNTTSFQFDHDHSGDQEIRTKIADLLLAKPDRQRKLRFDLQAAMRKRNCHGTLVNGLKKTVSQFVIDLVKGRDDRLSDVLMLVLPWIPLGSF
jgi:hypothetical protein